MENKKIKKALSIALIMLLIIFLLFLINTFRKFMIIKNMQKNIMAYLESTNYHVKSVLNKDNETIVTNYYEKAGKQTVIIETNIDGEISKISVYNNRERIDVFYDNVEERTVKLNAGNEIQSGIYNYLATENDWQAFCASITVKIKRTDYNGKDCYIISNFNFPLFTEGNDENEIYVEKDTGLCIKSNTNIASKQLEYEFENVNDEVFNEPDIGQYVIQE